MASIWKQNREVTNDVKRNNFPLSFVSHSTFKFGYLYPVFCKRVYPTDSFRIRSAFDLKMMPIEFPVQSRMRANLHFFYVRNKNLWSGWEDWISGLKSNDAHPHPYVTPPDASVKTGSIYDFLNTPTTVISQSEVTKLLDVVSYKKVGSLYPSQLYGGVFSALGSLVNMSVGDVSEFRNPVGFFIKLPSVRPSTINLGGMMAYFSSFDSSVDLFVGKLAGSPLDASRVVVTYHSNEVNISDLTTEVVSSSSLDLVFDGVEYSDDLYLGVYSASRISGSDVVLPASVFAPFYNYIPAAGFAQYSDLQLGYYRNTQPLNALPFRAYQSIYFGYYANDVLQPLVINGEKEYNKFIENDGDGLDTTDYHLYRRNYELDFLTSALPSPQAGPAPLVGISALGEVTITDANGVSTGQAEVTPSGEITKIVATSPMASIDHARTMMNIAALGFNINDLRSANALQRLAEQTLRSGYRYINWVKGQYGRSPEYRELDMPEFIGGYSRDIDMRTIISQADTLDPSTDFGKNLGDFAANGRVVGGSNHDITHYCDDYGWIIGIMSITPTPAYSQLLPKHMLAPSSPLDYANPFMNQIGMQPITYREVAPLQAYMDSLVDDTKSVDDVFGYQRPNYDDVGAVDEVHGEFRASLKDYLINRQFDGRPELGTEFLEINPSEINDIFVNQNPDDDVFIGHLAFQVDAKRPFPRVHIPGLGR